MDILSIIDGMESLQLSCLLPFVTFTGGIIVDKFRGQQMPFSETKTISACLFVNEHDLAKSMMKKI